MTDLEKAAAAIRDYLDERGLTVCNFTARSMTFWPAGDDQLYEKMAQAALDAVEP